MRHVSKADHRSRWFAILHAGHVAHFCGAKIPPDTLFTGLHKNCSYFSRIHLCVMIWGCIPWRLGGWLEMSGLFLFAGIAIGHCRDGWRKSLVTLVVGGARGPAGCGADYRLARGIVRRHGRRAHHRQRILANCGEGTVGWLNRVLFITSCTWIEVALSFFVPSTSGLAVLSMGRSWAPVAGLCGTYRVAGRHSLPVPQRAA